MSPVAVHKRILVKQKLLNKTRKISLGNMNTKDIKTHARIDMYVFKHVRL